MMTKDLDTSPFVAAMRRRGRPHKIVMLPGTTDKVALWVPTSAEREAADAAARVHITRTLNLDALQLTMAIDSKLHRRAESLELLHLVMRNPIDPTQAFAESVEVLRDPDNGFTEEDVDRLMGALREFTRERYEPEVPDDDAKLLEVVLQLKADGAMSEFVEHCAGDTAKRIAISLVNQWPTPTPPSSSAT